jgi:hypothetical protein
MPQPYSADLRERVLVAYEQGEGSQVAIAAAFASVRPPSATGSVKPATRGAAAPSPTAADRPGCCARGRGR